MEFGKRATDDSPSFTNYKGATDNSPNFTNYTTYQPSPVGLNILNMGSPNETINVDLSEANWRELQKKQIREEIIAQERRVLEAEVRRELMLERDLAMKMIHQPFPEETIVKSDCSETTPIQLQRSKEPEVKPVQDISKKNENVILVGKSEGEASGVKRKMEGEEAPLGGVMKKVKEDWSCVLCEVTTTSEDGLKEHLLGKKHKVKEEKMKNNGKSFRQGFGKFILDEAAKEPLKVAQESMEFTDSISKTQKKEFDAPLVKKNNKFKFWCEMCQKGADSQVVMDQHLNGKKHNSLKKVRVVPSPQIEQNGGVVLSPQIEQNGGVVLSPKIEQSTTQTQGFNDAKESDAPSKLINGDQKKPEYTFWCEMCQIGACSESVMENHRNGKKHVARIGKLNQTPQNKIEQAFQAQ